MFVTYADPYADPDGWPSSSVVRFAKCPKLVTAIILTPGFDGPGVDVKFRCDKAGDGYIVLFASALEDGNYVVTYKDATEGEFFVLFGDLNGDRTVDGADKMAFNRAMHSKRGAGNFRADCDFNGDGQIGEVERQMFAKNYIRTLETSSRPRAEPASQVSGVKAAPAEPWEKAEESNKGDADGPVGQKS